MATDQGLSERRRHNRSATARSPDAATSYCTFGWVDRPSVQPYEVAEREYGLSYRIDAPQQNGSLVLDTSSAILRDRLVYTLAASANGSASLLAFGYGLAKNKVVKQSLSFEGRKITYYLFVPEELDRNVSAPLVITLHGSGRNGQSLVDYWKKIAVKNKVIIVGPDASNPAGWAAPLDGGGAR